MTGIDSEPNASHPPPTRGYPLPKRVRRDSPDSDNYHRKDDGWKCLECHAWNPQESSHCIECGAYPSSEDLDEFGRVKRAPKPPSFPPCFDTNGSAYSLDVASGMFYEPLSDFFYDPKSKLYYGNKTQAYYSYDPTQKSPFVKVSDVPVTTASTDSTVVAQDNKPKIAIHIKSKSFKKNKLPPVPSKEQQKYQADMSKWENRQQEIKEPDVATTSKGEPVCTLCRRKFKSMEQLRYHERASQLHKDNLAKEEASSYVDRAAQRRTLHGDDVVALPSATLDKPAALPTEAVKPQDTLNESNIGHKMLQKLGWKKEDRDTRHSTLVKDWEKIESLAGNPKSSNTS